MRAHTVTTMYRRQRSARRAAAIVLAACSLAIPASAAAYTYPGSSTSGSEQSSQPAGELQSAHQVDPGNPAYSSLAATAPSAREPDVVSSSSADDGFDWSSAVIGAGVAMAVFALGGAAFLTARRRITVSPASSS